MTAEQPHEPSSRILVVDDDDDNRQLLRRMLERQGYSVVLAAGGQECLDTLSQSKDGFDLVLLDVLMPGLSGFEVLARIKETPAWQTLPVVVISALGESSAAIRCIKMGAEDYLPKPFDPVLLRARIGASVEKKRLRDKEAHYAAELEAALSELHGAKDRLVVQEKLASLGALTAGIAHELKNPLNFITNFAAVSRELAEDIQTELGKEVPARDEIDSLFQTLRENLERVESHGKRADHIVRDMLLHSHGQSGNPEPTAINSLLEEAIELAYHGTRAHNPAFSVRIDRQLAPDLPPIPVVARDISRVVINILNNSFYAIQEKRKSAGPDFEGRILAMTRETDSSVDIVLEDNGPGIPDDVRPRIFDPFFTTKPAGEGTGLGLSISYDIVVRAHGGSMTMETEPGAFTRFCVGLPKTRRP